MTEFEKIIDNLQKDIDQIESNRTYELSTILDEVDSLVIDIQEERITDFEEIREELKGIRDRIAELYV